VVPRFLLLTRAGGDSLCVFLELSPGIPHYNRCRKTQFRPSIAGGWLSGERRFGTSEIVQPQNHPPARPGNQTSKAGRLGFVHCFKEAPPATTTYAAAHHLSPPQSPLDSLSPPLPIVVAPISLAIYRSAHSLITIAPHNKGHLKARLRLRCPKRKRHVKIRQVR
jgi:hypothetical protein